MSYNSIATPSALNTELTLLVSQLKPGQTVLELGSGYTTRLIADALPAGVDFVSLEHSLQWYNDIINNGPHLKKFVRHAPLVDCGLGNLFYDLSGLDSVLQRSVALLLIDGPPGGKRWPGTFLLTKFLAREFVILADDMAREQYKHGLELLSHCYCESEEHRKEMLKYYDGWAKLTGKRRD